MQAADHDAMAILIRQCHGETLITTRVTEGIEPQNAHVLDVAPACAFHPMGEFVEFGHALCGPPHLKHVILKDCLKATGAGASRQGSKAGLSATQAKRQPDHNSHQHRQEHRLSQQQLSDILQKPREGRVQR
jgi:hypothetical protein